LESERHDRRAQAHDLTLTNWIEFQIPYMFLGDLFPF
jgi:hypothetical protein